MKKIVTIAAFLIVCLTIFASTKTHTCYTGGTFHGDLRVGYFTEIYPINENICKFQFIDRNGIYSTYYFRKGQKIYLTWGLGSLYFELGQKQRNNNDDVIITIQSFGYNRVTYTIDDPTDSD